MIATINMEKSTPVDADLRQETHCTFNRCKLKNVKFNYGTDFNWQWAKIFDKLFREVHFIKTDIMYLNIGSFFKKINLPDIQIVF